MDWGVRIHVEGFGMHLLGVKEGALMRCGKANERCLVFFFLRRCVVIYISIIYTPNLGLEITTASCKTTEKNLLSVFRLFLKIRVKESRKG